MKKYLEFFKASFKWSFENRLATLIWVFVGVFPVFIMFLVWSSVYSQGGKVGNMSLSQFVTYYFLVGLVNSLAMTYSSDEVPRRIKDGDLAKDLLRPYSFIGQQMAESLGYKLLSLFISLPSFLLLFLLMGSNIELNLGFATLAVFLVAVVFGFLLNFLFDFVLSVAAFYTTTAWWILHIKLISITILGGLSFPLSLFPEKVQQILNFLPFGYFVYFPTRVISMGASELDLLLPFGVMIFWVAIFAFLYKILWRLGLKKFTAVGI